MTAVNVGKNTILILQPSITANWRFCDGGERTARPKFCAIRSRNSYSVVSGINRELKDKHVLEVEAATLSNAWDDEDGLNMMLVVVVGNVTVSWTRQRSFSGTNNVNYVIMTIYINVQIL
jgi:hypothetical protein